MAGMTKPEILRLLHDYIGVGRTGIVEGLSHNGLKEFYPRFCDLEIDSARFGGTVRDKFAAILESLIPRDQAKVIRGTLKMFPPNKISTLRTEGKRDEWLRVAERLEGVLVAPTLREMTDLVWRAIDDAKDLLKKNGPKSAVDRVHTAMHAYFKLVCDLANIPYAPNPSIELLFGLIRDKHESFKDLGRQSENITKILRAAAKTITAINHIRNNASMAHPNELLGNDEAMLVINSAWTILGYIAAKLP